MDPTRKSESFAKSIIEKELILPVYQNDIGKGGYDLQIRIGSYLIAIEVKRLVSERYMELLGNTIEYKKIDSYNIYFGDGRVSQKVRNELEEMSVLDVSKIENENSISFLSLFVEGELGVISPCVKTMIKEVEGFVNNKKNNKIWKKIVNINNVNEVHIFIIVGIGYLSFEANSCFLSDKNIMPNMPPKLPEGVTGLWIVGMKRGVYWIQGKGWRKINEGVFK